MPDGAVWSRFFTTKLFPEVKRLVERPSGYIASFDMAEEQLRRGFRSRYPQPITPEKSVDLIELPSGGMAVFMGYRQIKTISHQDLQSSQLSLVGHARKVFEDRFPGHEVPAIRFFPPRPAERAMWVDMGYRPLCL